LIEGTAQIGPMSRPMKEDEIDDFVNRHGYEPTQVIVALDAVAVFINKDNPMESASMRDIDAIFSSTYKMGGQPVHTWGDLGLEGEYRSRPVSVYGRNSASGTYGFFKKLALAKGDYKASVKEQPGSSAVVQGIASDLYGIGYSGVGYTTSGVKTLAIEDPYDEGISYHPTFENAMSGDYPLARFLIMYVNKAPNQPLDALTLEFIKFIHSKQGQSVVAEDGYYPLPAEISAQVLEGLKR
jgi:phosphate transport system substrate-binding protein